MVVGAVAAVEVETLRLGKVLLWLLLLLLLLLLPLPVLEALEAR